MYVELIFSDRYYYYHMLCHYSQCVRCFKTILTKFQFTRADTFFKMASRLLGKYDSRKKKKEE